MSFGAACIVVLSLLACVVQSRLDYLLVERFNNSTSCDHKYFKDATAFVINHCINYNGNYMQFTVNDNVVSEYSCDADCINCSFEETIPNSCGDGKATTLMNGLPSYTKGLLVMSYYQFSGCARAQYVEIYPDACTTDTECYSFPNNYVSYSCGFPYFDTPTNNNTVNSTTTGKANSTSSSSGTTGPSSTTRSSSNATTTGSTTSPKPPSVSQFAWLSVATYYSSSCSASGLVSATYLPSDKCIPSNSGYGYFVANSGAPTFYTCSDAACKSCAKSQVNVTLNKCASEDGAYSRYSLQSTFPAYNNTRVEVEVFYQGLTCQKDVNNVVQVEVYQRGCSNVNGTCVASQKASFSKNSFCNPPAFLFNTPSSGSTSSAPVTYTTVITTTLYMSGNASSVKIADIAAVFAASLGVDQSVVKVRIVPKTTRSVLVDEYDFSIVVDVVFTTSNNQNEIAALKTVVETAVQSSSVNTVLGDQGVYVTSYATTSTTTANTPSSGGSGTGTSTSKTSSASWLLPSVSIIFALSMILLC